jgi:hypothetical protein
MPIAAETRLRLRIPEQSPPAAGSMTRPKDVAEWIQRLPMASGTDTAKKLFRALQGMNRILMPTQDRLQISQLLSSPIRYAITTLERKYIGRSFPLSEKTRLTALVCIRLNQELAYSYKSIIKQTLISKIGKAEQKLLALSLFRTLQHLSQIIFQSAQIYESAPRHIWQELHSLFSFADTNGWADLRVKADSGETTQVTTLRALYLQVVLFAAASPYRLRQREIQQVLPLLPEWADLIDISINTPPQSEQACFLVQLASNLPPMHASLAQPPLTKPFAVIQTHKLIIKLQQWHDELETRSKTHASRILSSDTPSSFLLNRLIQALSQAPNRQFVRTHIHFDLEIAVGLNKIYQLISGETPLSEESLLFDPDAGAEAFDLNPESVFASDFLDHAQGSGLSLEPLQTDDHVYLRGYDTFGLSSTSPPPQPEPQPAPWRAKEAPRPPPPRTATIQTLNESAGGYCVQWHGDGLPSINIGELIGIHAPGSLNSYGLAVARWMRQDSAGLSLGLQLIAPEAFAVTASQSDRRQRALTQCLLVPELKNAHRPASLVAPAMSFEVGMSVQIRYEETTQIIKLIGLVESSGAFSQFQFKYDELE